MFLQSISQFLDHVNQRIIHVQTQANADMYHHLNNVQLKHQNQYQLTMQKEQFREHQQTTGLQTQLISNQNQLSTKQHLQQAKQQTKQQTNQQTKQQTQHQLSILPILTKQNIFIQSKAHVNQMQLSNNSQLSSCKQTIQSPLPKYSRQLIQIITQKTFKINPRNNKFIKRNRKINLTGPQPQAQISSPIQQQKKSATFKLNKLRQKTMLKIQLKQKLRKLNQQLQKNRKTSTSADHSIYENQSSFLLTPQNISHTQKSRSNVSNIRQSIFTNKHLRQQFKSQVQFKNKNKYFRHVQQAYSPSKHQEARNFVSKMHQEKLKKHQKFLNDLRKKQEKQLQILRKLQQQKKMDKMIQRSRVVLQYDGRKLNKLIERKNNNNNKSLQGIKQKQSVSQNSKPFFNSRRVSKNDIKTPKGNSKQIQIQINPEETYKGLHETEKIKNINKQVQVQIQIGSIIPHQKIHRENRKKVETIYTQEFQAVTQQGKQFGQMLKQAKQQQQGQQKKKGFDQIDNNPEQRLDKNDKQKSTINEIQIQKQYQEYGNHKQQRQKSSQNNELKVAVQI